MHQLISRYVIDIDVQTSKTNKKGSPVSPFPYFYCRIIVLPERPCKAL